MASPISSTTTTETLTTTSDISSQSQNSNLSTESTIISAENRGCCQKITDFFSNILQWIKDHLCCCFSSKTQEGTAASTETTTTTSTTEASIEATFDAFREIKEQELRLEIGYLINFPGEFALAEEEKLEIITQPRSPHNGKTKEEAWNENKELYIEVVRNFGRAFEVGLEYIKENNYNLNWGQVKDSLEATPYAHANEPLLRNGHHTDPQQLFLRQIIDNYQNNIDSLLNN